MFVQFKAMLKEILKKLNLPLARYGYEDQLIQHSKKPCGVFTLFDMYPMGYTVHGWFDKQKYGVFKKFSVTRG